MRRSAAAASREEEHRRVRCRHAEPRVLLRIETEARGRSGDSGSATGALRNRLNHRHTHSVGSAFGGGVLAVLECFRERCRNLSPGLSYARAIKLLAPPDTERHPPRSQSTPFTARYLLSLKLGRTEADHGWLASVEAVFARGDTPARVPNMSRTPAEQPISDDRDGFNKPQADSTARPSRKVMSEDAKFALGY